MERKFFKTIGEQFSKKFVDIMALVVAIAAVTISMVQVNMQREFERIKQQPVLSIEFHRVDSEPMKGFKLSNVGYGPAVIKSFKYYLNDSDFRDDSSHIQWNTNAPPFTELKFEKINYFTEGYIIAEKELFILGTTASVRFVDNPISFYTSLTAKVMDSIIIEIEYTSMNPLDEYTYLLRFCGTRNPTNYREERD